MRRKYGITVRAPYLFLILIILHGIGFLVLNSMVQNNQEKPLSVSEVIGKDNNYRNNDFYVEMSISKSWVEPDNSVGAQYDGIFYNKSNNGITNWEIEIEVPPNSYIDSSWNGVYEEKDNLVKITPVDYNMTIEKNSNDTFGYVMYTPGNFNVEKLIVHGCKIYKMTDFSMFWYLVLSLFITIVAFVAYMFVEFRIRWYKNKEAKDKKIIIQALNTFANFIDAKDSYTKGHSVRVAFYSREIARRMGLKEEEQDAIYYTALLHDVGKVGIRNEILDKLDVLTHDEWSTIKMHTIIGEEILKDFTVLPDIKDGAKYHHERFDGGGYPNGLKEQDIPLCARIICIADSYDAMASDRHYRKKLDYDRIMEELFKCSGTQFDPDIVIHMIAMIQDGFINDNKYKQANVGSRVAD